MVFLSNLDSVLKEVKFLEKNSLDSCQVQPDTSENELIP